MKKPKCCYYALSSGEIVRVNYGEKGYYQTGQIREREYAKQLCATMNENMKVSETEANAMVCLSMQENIDKVGRDEYDRRFAEIVETYNGRE